MVSIWERENKDVSLNGQTYHFNKLFFGLGMLVLCFVAVFIMSSLGMDKNEQIYIHCPEESRLPCDNPMYLSPSCEKYAPELCNLEKLPIGFIKGKPEPPIVRNFPSYSMYYILVLFLLNHLIFNRHFSFKGVVDEANKLEDEEKGDD